MHNRGRNLDNKVFIRTAPPEPSFEIDRSIDLIESINRIDFDFDHIDQHRHLIDIDR